MVGIPSQQSENSREALPEVRQWLQALPEVQEWSGRRPNIIGVDGRPSRMSGRLLEALPKV